MRFELSSRVENIFILGAGASVDYGLPTWSALSDLIRARLNSASDDTYPRKKEILEWLAKVGDEKESYSTIDLCISRETLASAYEETGPEIQNEMFRVMKEICEEMYRPNKNGWIAKLSEKILEDRQMQLENAMAFVNYNYDFVLETNFLEFKHLPAAARRWNLKAQLDELRSTDVEALYPHGSFYPRDMFRPMSHINRHQKTMKSHDSESLDAVSCFDADRHDIVNYSRKPVALYILGVGNGLRENLSKLSLPNPVKTIHVTVHDPKLKEGTIEFLRENYKGVGENIVIHKDCGDLIENSF